MQEEAQRVQAAALWPSNGEQIMWATSWDRGAGLHGDNAFTFAVVTPQTLIFFQTKNNGDKRAQDVQVHRALAHGAPAAMADLSRLASGKIKATSVPHSKIREIGALGKLGVVQVQTDTGTLAVGGFAHTQAAVKVAEALSAQLLPGSAPERRAQPAMSKALLRQTASMPAIVAFFAAVVVAMKYLLVWDTPNTYNQRGEAMMRAVLDPVGAPLVILAAVVVVVGASLVSVSRLRDEHFWRRS